MARPSGDVILRLETKAKWYGGCTELEGQSSVPSLQRSSLQQLSLVLVERSHPGHGSGDAVSDPGLAGVGNHRIFLSAGIGDLRVRPP